MPVAFKHVARELLLVFAGVFALLLAVGLGGRFIGFLQQAAVGRFTADALWLLLALRVPEFVQVTVPFALSLATLLTFGRLHADSEFVAFATGGVGPGRVVRWLLVCALPLAALVGLLSFGATPKARRAYAELAQEQLLNSGLDAVSPGSFHVRSGGERVTYAEAVDPDTDRLRGFFMAEQGEGPDVVVWAESARQHWLPTTGSRFLELEDGVRYEGVAGRADYRVLEFARLGQRLARAPTTPSRDPRALPTRGLDGADIRHVAEMQWRMALPLMTVIAALVALGVARPPTRGGRFARVMPGVGVFVGYYVALVVAQDALADGKPLAGAGLWLVHVMVLALAAWLLRRSWRPT